MLLRVFVVQKSPVGHDEISEQQLFWMNEAGGQSKCWFMTLNTLLTLPLHYVYCTNWILKTLHSSLNTPNCKLHTENRTRARSLIVLWDKLRLLKNLMFLGSFGFFKMCLKFWYLPLERTKKMCFFQVFCDSLFLSWNIYHTFDNAMP